jgi:hypothetical protein
MGRTDMLVWLRGAAAVLMGIAAGVSFAHYAKTKNKASLVWACCVLLLGVIFGILALHSAGIIDVGWLDWSLLYGVGLFGIAAVGGFVFYAKSKNRLHLIFGCCCLLAAVVACVAVVAPLFSPS